MFRNKKVLKQIIEERKKLETLKNELLFIKENLEDTTPKVDISDLYVWEEDGLFSIVKLNIESIHWTTWYGKRDGFKSTLVDIFTNKILYTKQSIELINSEQWVNQDNSILNGHYAYLTPIYKFDNNILAYTE